MCSFAQSAKGAVFNRRRSKSLGSDFVTGFQVASELSSSMKMALQALLHSKKDRPFLVVLMMLCKGIKLTREVCASSGDQKNFCQGRHEHTSTNIHVYMYM